MAKWRRCPECNTEFKKHGNQIYCQPACRTRQNNIRNGKIIEKDGYQLPKCDCGGELEFVKEEPYLSRYKINKNGLVSKKRISFIRMGVSDITNLRCTECDNVYDYYYENNRIVRELEPQ